MFRIAILILFFGSGVTGLVYQVLWTKLLTLTFGVTFLAVSTVLTAFFGGLALGSYHGGRWVDKHGSGLKWYGIAEAGIGVYALLFLPLLDFNKLVYVNLAQMVDMGFFGLTMLKFVLAFVLLIIPTTLMGATLPILSKALAKSRSHFARDVGGLYTVNTFGAVVGALSTAFFFIPKVGVNPSIIAVGVFNLILGGIALYLHKSFHQEELEEEHEAENDNLQSVPGDELLPKRFFSYVVFLFAVSGFTALVYEVIWTRILGFILTGTIFAFTTVLATFLCGIAVGSLVFSKFLDQVKSTGKVINILAIVEILIGISCLIIIFLFEKLPEFSFYGRIDETQVWSEFLYLNFFTCFVILFLPTFLFGATFPLVCKVYSRRVEKVGTNIGDIYSFNTVGGIVGSFAGGFILIPLIGMHSSMVLMAFINVALGAGLFLQSPFLKQKEKYLYAGVSAVLVCIVIAALPENMPRSLHLSFLSQNEEVLYYKEGPTSTVMIAQRSGQSYYTSNKRLWVNGNMATAAFYEGLQINRFQGVLPMVLHPDPKDVLVVCFGSGTTFGTLSQFDVTMVDNVELSKTVIGGASYFKSENRDVLNNPKSNIIIDDGRSYLEVTSKKYDVMTMEPMHPSLAGVVNLYTKEYYELLKSHLKKDGLVSQWIPLYSLSVEDVKMMVKTFQSVFPHTTIWFAAEDIFMIGSPERLVVDYDRLASRLKKPNIHKLLRDIDFEDPMEFLHAYMMNEDQVREYSKGVPILTDSLPIIEYTGPRSLNVNTITPNLVELIKYQESLASDIKISSQHDANRINRILARNVATSHHFVLGKAYLSARNIGMAVKSFKKALAIDPTDRRSLHYKQKLLIFWNNF